MGERKPQVIRFKINPQEDRNAMVVALSHAGYKVWVEEKKASSWTLGDDFYVCVEVRP